MPPFVMQPAELFVLAPMAVCQAGILGTLRNRFHIRSIWFWFVTFLLMLTGAVGIIYSSFRPFAAVLQPIRTAALLWLLPSSAAYVLYLLFRTVELRTASPERRRFVRTAGLVAVTAPFAMEGWGTFVTRFNFTVEEVDLPIAGLPQDLRGCTILQLSDVHLSPFLSEREFARVIDAANELRPRIAVMTGDLISSWGDPVDACIAQLSRIKADAPLLGCLGNHEIYVDVERYVETQAARKGIRFLRRGRCEIKIGNSLLNIAGLDYQPFTLRGQYLRGMKTLVLPNATNILLSHNPDVFIEAPEQGWHATLAGHTHGGQVTVEILKQDVNVARFVTRYVSGLYVERSAACYVTRGVGTIGIPARVGAKPEITLLRLTAA